MPTNDDLPTGPNAPEEILSRVRQDIRTLTHDISSPLGVLRMAVYYLQTAHPDAEKRAHYYALMAQSIDRMDGYLKGLRKLAVTKEDHFPSTDSTPPDVP